MLVLKATPEQKQSLEGIYKDSELKFVLDGAGNYIVGLEVLSCDDFEPIIGGLNSLEKIEFIQSEIKEEN